MQELLNGSGNYEFDYYVMAVRKGHENYRVIRPADEFRPARSVAVGPGVFTNLRDAPVRVGGGER